MTTGPSLTGFSFPRKEADMKKYDFVLWDWNGTVLDDVSAALASVNDMLRRRNMKEIGIGYYRQCIGTPIKKFYEKVFELEKEDYPSLLGEYNAGYLAHLSSCGLAEGVRDVIEFFAENGAKQIIVSSCEKNQLTENVEKYGVSHYFDAVIGSEDFFAGSKIERAAAYLEKNGGAGCTKLVIGDLVHDYELSVSLGADCILLRSGHENPELLDSCPAAKVNSLKEIPEMNR